jgi:chemotaxis receptor (MCP) glutamine deamidase CheD/CheY-like chemotaxis protein
MGMDINQVFLLPCELCVPKEPTEISTLLGSCVSVCLFNRKLGVGGMNHFMLEKTPEGEQPSGKFGDYATQTLISMILAFDKNVSNLEASILGGGNVVGHLNVENSIGDRNLAIARSILETYRIRVVNDKYISDDYGRKVLFKTWTGEFSVRRIEKSEETRIIQEKKKDLSNRKIRVLVVDDSKTVRSIIIDAISQDPDIDVIGEAENPFEARELILEYDPDVICLDIVMPKMDGITFLKKLFLYKPKPVIIISTIVQKGSKVREQAKKIGAVAVVDKAELNLYARPDIVKAMLVSKIKAAAGMYVKKKTEKELGMI